MIEEISMGEKLENNVKQYINHWETGTYWEYIDKYFAGFHASFMVAF